MKKLSKSIMLLALTLILLLLTAACGTSFEYDEQVAEQRAQEVIDVIKTQDYDAIVSLFREDLQPLTTAEAFEEAWKPYLEDAGYFAEIKSMSSAGHTEKNGEQYIIAAVKCKYENASYIYTIVFDTDFNVTGLYLK